MRCPFCQGQHWIIRNGQMMPCPECGGMGELHCCEGMVARTLDGEESLCPLRNSEQDTEPVGAASRF